MLIWPQLANRWLQLSADSQAPQVAEQQVAVANPDLAKAIADNIRDLLRQLGLELNTGKDLPAIGVQQHDEKGFSFPLYPAAFARAKNIGYVQVKGVYSEPLKTHGPENAGKNITCDMSVCYYFKKPAKKGSGQQMFETPAGQVDVSFDDKGTPQLVDPGQVADVGDAVENLIDKIVAEPPPGSESEAAVDPNEERIKREQAEKAVKFKKQEQKKSGDAETHGSIESFVQYMEDDEQTTYGLADLQKLMNNLFNNANDRAFQLENVKKQLGQYGLKFDPAKKFVSSLSPLAVAGALRDLAATIDTSAAPSKAQIAARLEALLTRL
jgi:hypothetical protein